jgi:protein tyrosine/serine phosphatase
MSYKRGLFVLSVFIISCSPPIESILTLRNFGVVVPNRLYRSNLPTPKEFSLILNEYSLKSVLYLDDDDVPEERAIADKQHITFFHIPSIISDDVRMIDSLTQVLLDEGSYPMLIHCIGGADRTGRAVALYRFIYDRWSVSQAMEEMKRFNGGLSGSGGSGWSDGNRKYLEVLYERVRLLFP